MHPICQEKLYDPGRNVSISDNQTVQDFRYKVLRELKKIKLAWPELNYSTARGVLILLPSAPAIPPSSEPLHLVR